MDLATTMFNFLLDLTQTIGSAGQWLITPLNYVGVSPIMLFTASGFSVILGIHLVRLFIG